MRISIMAGGSSSRPDTLMQTGSAANLDKPPCRRGGPYVFESLDGPLVLSWMTGPRTDVGGAEFPGELSDIAGMKVDAEPLGDDALEVEPTPARTTPSFVFPANALPRDGRTWAHNPA